VSTESAGEPAPLPRRPPRPLVVHWLIDSAITFLVVVLVALFLGVSIWAVIVFALVLGIPLAPLTRGAEDRALARRDSPEPPVA
jgi:hypothetical protein